MNASNTFILYFLYMAIVLYDFEIRPWGGWPFVLVYISSTLMLVLAMGPWLILNDWPDELLFEMFESTEMDKDHATEREQRYLQGSRR